MLNMFRTLIYPSSGACDCVDELPHLSSCYVKTDDLALVYIYGVNMFWTLIYPSAGACDCVDELPHPSSCSVKTDDLASV